jgi:formiminotetrahydrofolate cyclodeaminase
MSLNLADPSLWNLTTAQLRDQVASLKPTPGGGSVSTITATLGLALVHKGVNVSLKRSASDPTRHQRLVGLSAKLTSLIDTLSAFADADSAAFESYTQARSLPHTTDIESTTRNLAMQQDLLRSTELPLESATEMIQALTFVEEALELADGHVISDIFSGALLLHASIKAVLLNVDANLGGIADTEKRGILKDRRIELESAALRMETISQKLPLTFGS